MAGALDEDAVSIHAGKDFALMRTNSGKVSNVFVAPVLKVTLIIYFICFEYFVFHWFVK